MNFGGLSERLIDFANCLVGWIRGGLGFVCVVTCIFIAAILGSSSACSAMVGAMLIPAMTKKGYDKSFAAGIVAASGGLGPLIPPSTLAIIYAGIAEVSINKMFVAGYVPGIILAVAFMVYAHIQARRHNWPAEEKPTVKIFFEKFKRAILTLLLPIIIMGSIMTGICTATESAVIAVIYCLILSVFVYKTIKITEIPKLLVKGARSGAMILIVISAASFLAYAMTVSMIPQTVTAGITALTTNPYIFLLLVQVILFIAGMFLDASCAIVILTPILLPVAKSLGVDPLFFGILMILNLQIGILTPPVGVNLYVAASVSKMDVLSVAKASVPFILMIGALVVVSIFVPGIFTFLPNLIG